MNKGWSFLFGAVLMATFLIWVIAPFFGWWLPDNVASFGGDVDYLFYVILGFTGFFFVLTEVILVYAMGRFVHKTGEKSEYTHGNHRLELLWTIVPAGILLFIAFAQITAWEKIKYQSRFPPPDLTLQVTARQWEWRMRYPLGDRDDKDRYVDRFTWSKDADGPERARQQLAARAWAETFQRDDVHVPNELHVWQGARVKVFLKTMDVLHSFTLPNLRLKQDTLPGKTIPIWFQVTRHNTRFVIDKGIGKCTEPADKRDAWEISCQELCGARHYAMRGRLYVHESQADYQAWLDHTYKQQQSHEAPKAVALVPAGNEPGVD